MTTTLNDRFQVLYELDRGSVVILSNQEHSTKILNKPAKAVDAWYPIREDYLKMEALMKKAILVTQAMRFSKAMKTSEWINSLKDGNSGSY